MIGILFFAAFGYFGYLVMRFGHPLRIAGVLTGIRVLFGIMSGSDLSLLIFGSAIFYVFTAFTYSLIDRFNDDIFLPIAILLGGAFIWFGAIIFT